MPRAIAAAFMPETPAPMTTTFAAYTPGTPPIRTPRPPWARINGTTLTTTVDVREKARFVCEPKDGTLACKPG